MLVPAYAATIHKSQALEYPAVIIPLLTQHYPMLQRKSSLHRASLVATVVVLVGQKKAIAIAVRNVAGAAAVVQTYGLASFRCNDAIAVINLCCSTARPRASVAIRHRCSPAGLKGWGLKGVKRPSRSHPLSRATLGPLKTGAACRASERTGDSVKGIASLPPSTRRHGQTHYTFVMICRA
jgi:hypothetical protein